jgi:RNA recognition motif-containing protein
MVGSPAGQTEGPHQEAGVNDDVRAYSPVQASAASQIVDGPALTSSPRAPDLLTRLYISGIPKSFTEAQLKPVFEQASDRGAGAERAQREPLTISKVDARPSSRPNIDNVDQGPSCPQPAPIASQITDKNHLTPARRVRPAPALNPQFGAVLDASILRDRMTGLSRGCGFVGFETSEEAEAAIQHLNSRVCLPGAAGLLEVGRGGLLGAGVSGGRL